MISPLLIAYQALNVDRAALNFFLKENRGEKKLRCGVGKLRDESRRRVEHRGKYHSREYATHLIVASSLRNCLSRAYDGIYLPIVRVHHASTLSRSVFLSFHARACMHLIYICRNCAASEPDPYRRRMNTAFAKLERRATAR